MTFLKGSGWHSQEEHLRWYSCLCMHQCMHAQADMDIFFFLRNTLSLEFGGKFWPNWSNNNKTPRTQTLFSLSPRFILVKDLGIKWLSNVAVLLVPNSVPPAFALCQVWTLGLFLVSLGSQVRSALLCCCEHQHCYSQTPAGICWNCIDCGFGRREIINNFFISLVGFSTYKIILFAGFNFSFPL